MEFSKTLDPGESEALALAIEVHADAVLIDEAVGRANAAKLGLTAIGVLGILLAAKKRGLVAALAPELDRLQAGLGFRVSDQLRADVLRQAAVPPPKSRNPYPE